MANHKSAKKRARQTLVRTARNRAETSAVRTAIKSVRAAIVGNDKEAAAGLFKAAQTRLAKLAQTGVIKANTAARRTSRLASQIARL